MKQFEFDGKVIAVLAAGLCGILFLTFAGGVVTGIGLWMPTRKEIALLKDQRPATPAPVQTAAAAPPPPLVPAQAPTQAQAQPQPPAAEAPKSAEPAPAAAPARPKTPIFSRFSSVPSWMPRTHGNSRAISRSAAIPARSSPPLIANSANGTWCGSAASRRWPAPLTPRPISRARNASRRLSAGPTASDQACAWVWAALRASAES